MSHHSRMYVLSHGATEGPSLRGAGDECVSVLDPWKGTSEKWEHPAVHQAPISSFINRDNYDDSGQTQR